MATYNIKYVSFEEPAPLTPLTEEQEAAIVELKEAYRIQSFVYNYTAPISLRNVADSVFYEVRERVENRWPRDYGRMADKALF